MSTLAERLHSALTDRYRIERELGAGGMATVYLAHDVRHDRHVALKVLRPELAAVIGAERFLHEIKTTANLQHPHILPLHDSGEVDGRCWYVMPLVEGESLRDRLQRETQLPIEEAVAIAREVASALDYAHRHGVIHRDIKPENILLHDGRALVADFGIALAVSRTDGGTRLTETGMSLGTPYYMSPEQALGERAIDGRADVYALGAVTYEMLTGEPPFTGPTMQAIVAKVISATPAPISAIRATVPPTVDAAVMRSLAKLPADRFRSAAEFAAALQGAMASSVAAAPAVVASQSVTATDVVPRPRDTWRVARVAPWLTASAAVILAVVFAMRAPRRAQERVTAAVIPLELRTPTDLPLNEVGSPISVAPDGSFLIYVGADPDLPGVTALWKRSLDRPRVDPDTGHARSTVTRSRARRQLLVMFRRRDARGTGNDRWEIGLDGGLPRLAPLSAGLKRLRGGRVLFLVDSGFAIVDSGKAPPAPAAATADRPTTRMLAVDVSSDGRWIAAIAAWVRPTRSSCARSKRQRDAVAAGVSPVFLDNDLLAFRASDGTLQVARLNADRTGFTAAPVPMVPNVGLAGDGSAQYSVGDDGTLVYVAGGATAQSRLVWVNGGREQLVPNVDSHIFGGVALSPDDQRAAVGVGALSGSGDVSIVDLALGSSTPLTGDGISSRAIWSHDGRDVTYLHVLISNQATTAAGTPLVWRRRVDSSAPPDSLGGPWPELGVDELQWSPDGQWIAIRTRLRRPGGPNRDIVIRQAGGATLRLFTDEPSQERGPRFSPDGKWLLYVSDRSGRDEVYAELFPNGGNRVQLSSDGGREGTWSRDGTQVFYRAPDGWMMSVRLNRGATLSVASRTRLFDASTYLANQFLVMYDVAADGRFLMFKLDPQPARTDVVIIRNWVQEVRARLGMESR